jgi:putative hydroxymethylpyrimidine transport system ATP-binding protein
MLSLSGLEKRFDDLLVFSGFDLNLPVGGFTVMVGPSGCGKTTLLDVLTGVVTSQNGTIQWGGETVAHLGPAAAYMQQNDLLLPWLSLLDNALLPATVSGRGDDRNRREAVSLFEQFGLSGFEDYLPRTVSGGMRQRCALVRTLMFDRDLVLLDEPLSALDAITRRSLQKQLLLLQSRFGKTLLMITHDVEEALLLADTVVVLSTRPMRIIERVTVTAAKPRPVDHPDLVALKARILEQLEKDTQP